MKTTLRKKLSFIGENSFFFKKISSYRFGLNINSFSTPKKGYLSYSAVFKSRSIHVFNLFLVKLVLRLHRLKSSPHDEGEFLGHVTIQRDCSRFFNSYFIESLQYNCYAVCVRANA